ncbi:MAG TPA: hypothetical protein VEH06_06240 [Candidatus Bathyarchaeia archaeon]|nr:hypothetical protein [Candidatus Bathyarchaeia archaeon]
MSKSKIVMTLATSIVVVLALASFNPTAYSQPTPTLEQLQAAAAADAAAAARNPIPHHGPITLILPSGATYDFKATPDQLQAILIRVISSNLGQTNTTAAGADQTAIKENVAASLNATYAASDAIKAAHIKEAAGFQQPGACVETFGVTTCID